MAKYRALQAFPIGHPGNPKRQLLVRAGDEVELADGDVAEHAIGVSIERIDQDSGAAEPAADDVAVEDILNTTPRRLCYKYSFAASGYGTSRQCCQTY